MASTVTDYTTNIETHTVQLTNIATMIAAYITTINDSYSVDLDIIKNRLQQLIEDCSLGEPVNRCVDCGIDMGIDNPRQYCCKTYCGSADNQAEKY